MSDIAPRSEATVADERLSFLARVGEILSSSLEYETTLERVAALAVDRFADLCSIELLDEQGTLRNVAIAHAEPARAEWLRGIRGRFPVDDRAFLPALEVVRSGVYALLPEITDDLLAERARSAEHLDVLRRIGFASALVVPLQARERTFGAISFATTEAGRRFADDDVDFALQLARRAALAIDNARLFRDAELAVQAADESGVLLDALFMRSPIAKAFLDRELRFARLNEAMAAIAGAPADALLGRSADDAVPTLAPQLVPHLRRALAGDSIVDVEVSEPPRAEDATPRHWLASCYPIPSASGDVIGVGALLVEITARKEVEHALRASEARKQAIVDSALDGIVSIDAAGRIVELNPAAEHMFGVARADVLGCELAAVLIPERLRDAHRRALAGFRSADESTVVGKRLQMPALRADGNEFPVELTVTCVQPDGDDAPPIFSATVRDLSERERLRHEREELEHALFEAQKLEAVGRLAGGVAHDFNNLLTVVLGFANILSRRLDDPALARYADQINAAAERGARLTRQMLAFSRQQVLEPQPVDLSAIVRELEPMLEPMLGEDVELVADLDPALPAVLADPGQLEQVLLNLASNARDAMPEGGRLTISTSAPELSDEFRDEHLLRPSRYVLLEVSDTGIGMDERTRARLFEPFFTTKPIGKGTGLGLASSYGIVEQTGGTIEVESAPGRGATFRIYLPQAEREAGTPSEDGAGRTTVLVVEDNHGLRDLASLVLEEAGFAVLSAASGPEALAVSAGHPGRIDLLLTDLVMPGMSGTKLAERLRAQRLGLNVVYMTGYGGSGDKELTLPPGSDLLVKPFLPEQLLERIEAALRGRPATDG